MAPSTVLERSLPMQEILAPAITITILFGMSAVYMFGY